MDIASPRPGSQPSLVRALLRSRPFVLLVATLVAAAAWLGGRPLGFAGDAGALARVIAVLGFLTLGEAVVLIAGGIDLSVGAVSTLAGLLAGRLALEWLRAGPVAAIAISPAVILPISVVLTILAGLAVGLWNGLLVEWLHAPPLLATLATAALLSAPLVGLADERAGRFDLLAVTGARPEIAVVVFLVAALIVGVVIGMSVLGRHLYAVGGNAAAAHLAGLPVRRLRIVGYVISGGLAALGGLLCTGANPLASGGPVRHLEPLALAAAILGGCSPRGGVGSIGGVVLASVLTGLLVVASCSPAVWGNSRLPCDGLVGGGLLIVALAFDRRGRSRG